MPAPMIDRDLSEINAELAEMMRERLGVRGEGLAAKLRRAGRTLPRPVRRAGDMLVETERRTAHPKLRRQVDPQALTEAEAVLRSHLEGIDRADRRRGYWIGVLTPLAFNLLLVIFCTTAALVWAGRI